MGDTGSYNSQNSIEDSLSLNRFNHSEYNVLLNNVSSSLISKSRRLYEPVYGTTSSILSPVQLQDSYLSLKSYQTSRYEGSKLISLEYNTYTSSSYTSSDDFTSLYGDKSYGKTAAIDHYVRKIGLFTQVETSSYLPLRNNVAIKYLVDEFGNLTELNQQNKHWEEIQNTFKANNTLNISLFDNKKFANQKLTEGDKNIFDSGYSYYPILYATGSCPTDEISFENLGNPTSYLSSADNSLSPFFITGSATGINQYSLIPSESVYIISKLFDNITQGGTYLSPGGLLVNNLPSYSVQENSPHKINATFQFNLQLPESEITPMEWKLEVWKNNTLIGFDNQTFSTVPPTPPMFSVYVNNCVDISAVGCMCSLPSNQPDPSPVVNVYSSTNSLIEGSILYTDPAKTNPLTGWNFIRFSGSPISTIYLLNQFDGIIGNVVYSGGCYDLPGYV